MGVCRDAVVKAVRDRGPISFADYMELALYGPGGFYERPPVGAEGDFITSPHVHPIFATLLSEGLRQMLDALGGPGPFRVAEMGAGDGTLAAQLVDGLADVDPVYTAIERSSGARVALAGRGRVRVAETLKDNVEVVLAHELLDNLPFRRIGMAEEGPFEVRVGLDERDRLHEVAGELGDDPAMLDVARTLSPGQETVIPDGADAFMGNVAASLRRGYALIIDYGGVGIPGGGTHGYRGHRVLDIPIDEPGTTDITVGVDFARLARRAEALGLVAFPTVTQFEALRALGFESWVAAELRRQHALLAAGDAEAVRAWSARSRASLLVDPSALGRFRWLVLATPDLPAPRWLAEAGVGSPQ